MYQRHVLILGATSTVAACVARLWAAQGDRLHLVGRSAYKLADLSRSLGTDGITTRQADFADLKSCEAVVQEAIRQLGGRIDVVLIAHGDLGDQLLSERDFAEAERILTSNFTSAVALLVPLAQHMESAGAGQVAVITSVAGGRGRPRNYTYGAAKGALGLYLQGIRSRLYRAGVTVTELKLGPVDTPMTRDHPKNALFGEPEGVAREIVRAIERRRRVAYVPGFWRWIMAIVRPMPEALFQRFGFLSGR